MGRKAYPLAALRMAEDRTLGRKARKALTVDIWDKFDAALLDASSQLVVEAKREMAKLGQCDPRDPKALRLMHSISRKQKAIAALSAVSYWQD